jgi:hypothetical protein
MQVAPFFGGRFSHGPYLTVVCKCTTPYGIALEQTLGPKAFRPCAPESTSPLLPTPYRGTYYCPLFSLLYSERLLQFYPFHAPASRLLGRLIENNLETVQPRSIPRLVASVAFSSHLSVGRRASGNRDRSVRSPRGADPPTEISVLAKTTLS